MKPKILILAMLTTISQDIYSQTYPAFGPEIKVTITGLTFDAMEPFISPDENILFFNSLNADSNTNLYHATRVDDTTFNFIDLVSEIHDPSPVHLNAVPSMDTAGNFFWVSVRGYPTQIENLHRGKFSNGNVTDISRVYGDFNVYEFNFPYGWLIMDAAINYQGNNLYYCNAKFDFNNTLVPLESKIGVAEKVNDSVFNKMSNTETIFTYINDTNYLVYAPQVTKDGLELYYTRLLKGSGNTEICVSVRDNINDAFSLPQIICSNYGYVPEAPTITSDKQKIYYHQKNETGIHRIFLRYRTRITGIDKYTNNKNIKIYPNPTNNNVNVVLSNPAEHFTIFIYSIIGQEMYRGSNATSIDISNFPNGNYFLTVMNFDRIWTIKIVKE